jgi:hypothetical protein
MMVMGKPIIIQAATPNNNLPEKSDNPSRIPLEKAAWILPRSKGKFSKPVKNSPILIKGISNKKSKGVRL